ncbi:DUF2231 domain-containing protein [Mycobacterium spongiae]|uniref:DUF2231 domain-containing protein n=1 Tax=Mycobacterium spongiae TaxID=886343 RepID=A0A975JUD5_9MYCO|nr:DUF2231 domain-containing protein [Mycobacterium spongiae]QUR65872.1 hypothetical protein F6B93_01200 [Mycobacterium spongiae]
MSTINGLPAHILLNHFVIVLGPLAAILAMLCALWPAARQRLIWPVLFLSVVALILTPLTTNAGTWLAGQIGTTPAIETHIELGETLVYMMAALVATVALLVALHIQQSRGRTVKLAVHALIVGLVITAAAATLVQTYRVGESGARAAWGGITASAM